MKIIDLKQLIVETYKELSEENLPPGFSTNDFHSLSDFTKDAENTMSEAFDDIAPGVASDFPKADVQSYIQKIANRDKKDNVEKYKYPYVHRSNIVDDAGNVVDSEVLKRLIMQRPERILKQNKKMGKSGGEAIEFYDISLPALKGLVVDEATGEFKIVNTCPGAGACKVYCYARRGGYVQWKRSSLFQTRVLNFLLNDWQGWKSKLLSEIQAVAKKGAKRSVNKDGKKYNVIIRWHDSGDFLSEKYLNVAFDVARATPDVLHYAYTKRVEMVAGAVKPDNFVFNFSAGAVAPEEKRINPKIHKHSVVVPKPMFSDLVHKNEEGGWDFNTPEDEDRLKEKMAMKYSIDRNSIITYAELMKTPQSNKEGQWNVIVKPGDGDDAASRKDVLGTYLLVH